ncbi:MAG: hypothetical protein QXQ87_09700 [Halobacteria archaeon]
MSLPLWRVESLALPLLATIFIAGCAQSPEPTPVPAGLKGGVQPSPLEYIPPPTPSGYAPRPFRWVPPQSSGPPVPRDPEIDRILRGLLRANVSAPKDEYFILYWIARVYPLAEVEEAARAGALDADRRLPESAVERALLRSIDPDYRPPWVGCAANATPALCAHYYGLYCDILPLPLDLLPALRAAVRKEGGLHPSLLLGLAEMERRGCGGPEAREALRDAQDSILGRMAELYSSGRARSLLFAEWAATLIWTGARDRLQPEWMAAIQARLEAEAPLLERGDSSASAGEVLWGTLATLLWRQGR